MTTATNTTRRSSLLWRGAVALIALFAPLAACSNSDDSSDQMPPANVDHSGTGNQTDENETNENEHAGNENEPNENEPDENESGSDN